MQYIRIKIITNALRQSYLSKAFGLLSLTQAMNAVVSFGIMSAFTKMLPPQDYGKISIIWILVTILSILIDSRLNTAFSIKYYKNTPEDNIINIYSTLLYNLLLSALLYLVILAFPGVIQFVLRITLTAREINLIFSISTLMVISNFLLNLLMVSRKPKAYFFVMSLFNSILIVVGAIFLYVLKSGYVAYLYAYCTAYGAVSLVCCWYLLTRYRQFGSGLFSRKSLRILLKLSFPLIPDALMLMILAWSSRYILNLYAGMAVVGIYSVAFMFSSVFNNFIITPFAQAVCPILFEKFVISKQEYTEILAQIFKYYWLIIFTIMCTYFVVLKEFFNLFVGSKYAEAYNIIGIIMLGVSLSGAVGLLGATIVMNEKTQRVFGVTLVTVIANLCLNFLLVPAFGLFGAAFAMLLSYGIQFSLILTFTQRLTRVHYDYKFVCQFSAYALIAIGMIVFISYQTIPLPAILALKVLVFGLYIFTIMKDAKLKADVKNLWGRFAALTA